MASLQEEPPENNDNLLVGTGCHVSVFWLLLVFCFFFNLSPLLTPELKFAKCPLGAPVVLMQGLLVSIGDGSVYRLSRSVRSSQTQYLFTGTAMDTLKIALILVFNYF